MMRQCLNKPKLGLAVLMASLFLGVLCFAAFAQQQELRPADELYAFEDKAGQKTPLQVNFPKTEVNSAPFWGEFGGGAKKIAFPTPLPGTDEAFKFKRPLTSASSTRVAINFPDSLSNTITRETIHTSELPNRLWWVFITAFAAGIGLSFTPCVLGLIPILSSVLAGQGKPLSRARATGISSIFTLGTALSYAAMGAIAGGTGGPLQAYIHNARAIGSVALICFMIALSMFSLYATRKPSCLQSSAESREMKADSLLMIFILGLLSALIVGACFSPILIPFLSPAIAKGSATLGAITLFSMAIGMGVPLVLLGVGVGHLLPKAGMWLDTIKFVFGVLLLGNAIYLLSVLPKVPVLYLWTALLIIVAINLGATQRLPVGGSGWHKLSKGIGTFILIWGGFSLIGSLYGETDAVHPQPKQLMASSIIPATPLVALSHNRFSQVGRVAQRSRPQRRDD